MLTQEIRQLIIDSCFKRPTQMMLDIRPEFFRFILTRYPFAATGNIDLYEDAKENNYLLSDCSGTGCSIYFDEQEIPTPYEIGSCDVENIGKSWFIAMSLRGPIASGVTHIYRHVQGRKYKCCFDSPSEENRDMMDFCNELAHKFGIHYVTYEDLCSIDFEATDEILERFDEYIDRPNAFQMLFD